MNFAKQNYVENYAERRGDGVI